MVKENTYISLMAFMVNDLHLKGNELIVYAIIYGFSQDEESCFNGGLQYLADWTDSTKQGVMKVLKSLQEKNLITKSEAWNGSITRCFYKAVSNNNENKTDNENKIDNKNNENKAKNENDHETKFNGAMKQSLTNNIYNNITNNIEIEKGSLAEPQESQSEQTQTEKKDSKVKPAKPKVVRHKYGHYQNVLLSDEQYQSLVNKHGTDKASWLIERLSEYIASSGRTYKNYLVTLNGWVLRAWEEEQKHNQNNNNNRAIINSVRNSLYGGMPDSANNDNSNDDNTFYL